MMMAKTAKLTVPKMNPAERETRYLWLYHRVPLVLEKRKVSIQEPIRGNTTVCWLPCLNLIT